MIPGPDVGKAKMFAEIQHAGQIYTDQVPYTWHLYCVVEALARFGITDPAMVCAAWLHDSIEDTNTSYGDIEKRFGHDVAELVYAVTSELGRNRKERNAKTYPKLKGNRDATILKLADRIANVEYGAANGGKNDMYAKEFPGFFAGVFDPAQGGGGTTPTRMWAHVAKLLGYTLNCGEHGWYLLSNTAITGIQGEPE